MRMFDHKRPAKDSETGEDIMRPSPVTAVTNGELDGSFGIDKGCKLVLRCEAGDIITLRPLGTRRPSSMRAVDVYRYMLRSEANKKALERARERKEAKARRLATARLNRAERKLRLRKGEEAL